jgi:hypothetical protein
MSQWRYTYLHSKLSKLRTQHSEIPSEEDKENYVRVEVLA